MKIFYDHQAFSLQNFGGVSRIFSELLKRGNKSEDFHAHLSILFSQNSHLAEINTKYSTFFNKREIPKRVNQLYNIWDLSVSNYDIYHPTYYDPSLIKYAKNKPVIATFHDMIHEKFSNTFPELKKEQKIIDHKKEIAFKASHIIAVSENTKKDLMEIYGIDQGKITVIHLGSSLLNVEHITSETDAKPYLLFVGNRSMYKNFKPFLKAIVEILKENNIDLICAGGKNFTKDETEFIHTLKADRFVKQIPINDGKLADLYANALAFVFPSLYEGFGIPVIEAFSCNCPCLLSNTSSLPEVAKGAALYFDPYDSDSMAYSVNQIITDSFLRNNLIVKGKEQLKNFSWDKHVAKTLAVYKKQL